MYTDNAMVADGGYWVHDTPWVLLLGLRVPCPCVEQRMCWNQPPGEGTDHSNVDIYTWWRADPMKSHSLLQYMIPPNFIFNLNLAKYDSLITCLFALLFWNSARTEHGMETAVLCAKLQNNSDNEMDFVDNQDFVRFEFKTSLRCLYCINSLPVWRKQMWRICCTDPGDMTLGFIVYQKPIEYCRCEKTF